MLRPTLGLLTVLAVAPSPSAQNHHSTLVGSLDLTSGENHADVWGQGDLAFVGRYFQNRVDIVDVSDPSSPTLRSSWNVPGPNNGASAQDVKVVDGLMFVALEYDDPHGVEVVDVRNPDAPAHLTWIDPEPGTFEEIHNLFVWEGWLFVDNSADNTVGIVDLRGYDPDAAPATIDTYAYQLLNVGGTFVHDITVANGLLFCAAWDSLYVYDVSDLDGGPPIFRTLVKGLSCHSVWPTEDGAFVVTAEERAAGGMRLYEVVGEGASLELVQRDSWVESLDDAFCVHNPIVVRDRVYASHYQAGLLVLEIDRVDACFREVARYDTNPFDVVDGFAGAWGVYPLDGADRVLVSDLATGLSIVDVSGLGFEFPDGRPADLVPGVPTTFRTRVVEHEAALAGDVTFAVSVDGRPFVAWPMTDEGGGVFATTLPPVNRGAEVRWYVRATDAVGRTFQHPLEAPASTHRALATDLRTTVFFDDFETDQGWTVDAAPAGTWTRDVPFGTYTQPDGGAPSGVGSFAFVTGNAVESASLNDVDGGTTVLTSPVFSLGAAGGRVSYERWYFNDDADPADALRVEVSSGTSGWVEVDAIELRSGGWQHDSFVVADHVSPSSSMRVRFLVADDPNDSLTDAVIDEFRVERFDEAPGLVFSIDPAFAGGTSRLRTTGAVPGEPVVVGYSLAGEGAGPCLFGGALCLDLVWPITILGVDLADAEGTTETVVVTPATAAGVDVSGQAVALRGTGLVDSVSSNPATVTIL